MKVHLSLAAVPLSVARPLMKGWNKKGLGVQVVQRFLKKNAKNRYRLYLPINAKLAPKVVPPNSIKSAIEQAGYKIEDYVAGLATTPDGKRKIRIGKILKGDALLNFTNDKNRQAFKDEFFCVISAHPYDVIGMSTGRRWDQTSCMRLGTKENGFDEGSYSGKIMGDVAEGTLVAYAIKPSDTNIAKPHARLLIKPFKKIGKPNAVYFKVETKVYGTPVPGFRETVSRWLKRVNRDAEAGYYMLPDDLYEDGIGYNHLHVKYDEIVDKVTFYREQSMYMTDTEWFKFDKRWLRTILEAHQENASSDSESIPTILAHAISEKIPADYVGKCIDDVLQPKAIEEIIYEIPIYQQSGLAAGMLKSKKVQAAIKAEFEYAPMESADDDWIIDSAAYHDSRWLAEVRDVHPNKLASICRNFLHGRLKWTPELAKSRSKGAQDIIRFVGIAAKVLLEGNADDFKLIEKSVVEKLAKQTKSITLNYSKESYDLINRGGLSRVLALVSRRKINFIDVLIKSDINWLINKPSWMGESDVDLFPHFDALLASKEEEILVGMLMRIHAKLMNSGSVEAEVEWFKSNPNIVAFVRTATGISDSFLAGVANKILKIAKMQ